MGETNSLIDCGALVQLVDYEVWALKLGVNIDLTLLNECKIELFFFVIEDSVFFFDCDGFKVEHDIIEHLILYFLKIIQPS